MMRDEYDFSGASHMPKFTCTEADPWSPEKTAGKTILILHPAARDGEDGVRACPICGFRWEEA